MPNETTKPIDRSPVLIDLALQGGGSHGAFTWGVLDALIEDGRLAFEAMSGTSACAMNAAIMMQGWSQDTCSVSRAERQPRGWPRTSIRSA